MNIKFRNWTDDQYFTLINLYNPNTESEQLEVFEKLENMLSTSNLTQGSQIIFASVFNSFFNSKLGSDGGNPVYKNRSVAKLIESKEKVYFDQYLENSKSICKKIYLRYKIYLYLPEIIFWDLFVA